ncbi:fluoride efflux transporter CrcB [Halopenitus persicus]|uniref:Fluoride-specific ion channel FluC n=1 Tax=Halopenitus persicus TaxID=1048396 RepID=A0A1H3KZH8_9EURY|nr:fluoride efflux transporter CrcB [Halopenitus persicus]QHS18058.1 fluoride efflux transporter CrcB [haloarchaeon 3A1-DGR]SDY57592.1 CrcB protein [Halopenitus persicus]
MVDASLLVGLGAATGALLRHGTASVVASRLGDRDLPYGTATVNVVGSFVLGLVTFSGASTSVQFLVGTGACGAYTTFSSFSVETVRLWESGRPLLAGWYAVANLAGALAALGAARAVVTAV